MQSEFDNIYYAISKNGYVLINDNEYDYSKDIFIIELIKKYKKLILGDLFNQSIDFLPLGITHLQLGRKFNKPINNFPRSLLYLTIASNHISYCDFNQSLDYLPESLEYLIIKLNKNLNIPINNLPGGLKYLHFMCKTFNYPINNLPIGLETLIICKFDFTNTHYLPPFLKKIIITDKLSEKDKTILKQNLIEKYPDINFELINSN